ncbi:MAG TPA: thermonuclease family protein [Rickettsiales bacterium]|nr:thermonuclease family protein [Rickettsiales bacterium]
MKKLFLLFYFFLFSTPLYALDLNQAFLDQFNGIALKTIRNSETVFSNSNKTKNEFNGIKDFKNILGDQRKQFNTKIIYLNDSNEYKDNIKTTWYSNIRNDYFLYHQTSQATNKYMQEGDLMLLGKVNDDNLVILIIKKDSQKEKELLNLFHLTDDDLIKQQKQQTKTIQDKTTKPVIEQTNSVHSDTSNLKEYDDLKIYKNTNTNKIIVVGKATEIKDGDTIKVSDLFTVRLYGIDTPEKKQFCKDSKGKEYNCGIKAKEYLQKIIGKQNLTCVNNGNEKYGRFLFVCKTGLSPILCQIHFTSNPTSAYL